MSRSLLFMSCEWVIGLDTAGSDGLRDAVVWLETSFVFFTRPIALSYRSWILNDFHLNVNISHLNTDAIASWIKSNIEWKLNWAIEMEKHSTLWREMFFLLICLSRKHKHVKAFRNGKKLMLHIILPSSFIISNEMLLRCLYFLKMECKFC